MKITKNKAIKANDEIMVAEVECNGMPTDGTVCKYNDAICNIQAAIEILAAQAKDDQIAKDSIANLSVVLMDLKSNC